ncbi:MupG family TIM beta-alpha barrel fold protein [Spiroplasma mirum]|nr:MupG family TIM beta-alpha barrel fold protein [Spiroplasma atrichopogonis]AKM52678.1 hypothetical protein SATRI_v1c00920 [Spiroplasma atrichopogonis]
MNVRIGTSIFIHLLADDFNIEKYLTTCAEHKISFIFTTLIGFQKKKKNNQKLFTKMKAFTKKAQELKIAVYSDLDQHLFNKFNIDKNNREEMMAFFVQQLGLSGVLFDDRVTGPLALQNYPIMTKILK